ncbi:MAG: M48 family metallopeptidase [Candidatus Methylacidiphilales bacterium]
MASKRRRYLGLAVWAGAWLVILAACVHIPETGKSAFILISPAEEAAIGAQAFNDLKRQGKVSTAPAINARVQRVANRLIQQVNVPNARWEVVVFDDPTPNAFALPGGKIGIHTGILPITENDAGLATVLGHELAHVTLRHGAQRFSQQAALALGGQTLAVALQRQEQRTIQLAMAAFGVGSTLFVALPFSRSQELEADQIGLRYMARSGYDPKEALGFWRRMAAFARSQGGRPPEWLSTHPADENRLSAMYQMMPLAEMEYQRAIGGG